jgi:hypothetical protein
LGMNQSRRKYGIGDGESHPLKVLLIWGYQTAKNQVESDTEFQVFFQGCYLAVDRCLLE